MNRFTRIALIALPALPALILLAGCLNWQGTYDESARSQCRSMPNISDRQACMDSVARNSAARNAEHSGH